VLFDKIAAIDNFSERIILYFCRGNDLQFYELALCQLFRHIFVSCDITAGMYYTLITQNASGQPPARRLAAVQLTPHLCHFSCSNLCRRG